MYYNNKSYYVAAIEISFFELLEIEELNPNVPRWQIIQDVVESCLGTLHDVEYEYVHMLEKDSIVIKAWSNNKVNSGMYLVSRNGMIPVRKPQSLQFVLSSRYNFGATKANPLLPLSAQKLNMPDKKSIIKNDNYDTKGDKYNGICNKCGSPAYIGLNNFECSKGCE